MASKRSHRFQGVETSSPRSRVSCLVSRVLSAAVTVGRIRASISQFQQELIGHVKEAVSALQEKFRHRYEVR